MSNILLMPFTDESCSFTNGFECGQIWEKLQSAENLDRYLIHTCNISQIQKIAEVFLTELEVEQIGEWSYITTKKFNI